MRLLCPNEIHRSVLEIDLDSLAAKGLKGLLIDIDNTLVPWNKEQMTEEFLSWIKTAKDKRFRVCLVSNGLPARVARFAEMIDVPGVSRALKPRRGPFIKGLSLLGLKAGQVAMIGDQLFTDVLGGNRLGLYTILIDPLSTKELRSTKLVRRIERRILRRLVRNGLVDQEVIRRRNGGSK